MYALVAVNTLGQKKKNVMGAIRLCWKEDAYEELVNSQFFAQVGKGNCFSRQSEVKTKG